LSRDFSGEHEAPMESHDHQTNTKEGAFLSIMAVDTYMLNINSGSRLLKLFEPSKGSKIWRLNTVWLYSLT
jgi:hypothetical protein